MHISDGAMHHAVKILLAFASALVVRWEEGKKIFFRAEKLESNSAKT
jgi:hypothetical protein